MALRVRSASKWPLLLQLAACSTPATEQALPWQDASRLRIEWHHGKAFTGNQLLNAMVYALDSSGDTVEISGFRDGVEDGTWKKFYPGGHLAEVRSFAMGKKTGLYTAWWPNGQRKLEYHFDNGEYEGCCREWGPDGKPAREMHYHRGYEEGSQKLYYEDGRIKANYVMTHGRRYGLLGTKNCVNVSDSIFKK